MIQLHFSVTSEGLSTVWPTPRWERFWQCSFRWRTNWVWWNVPPKTWHRSVWAGWGKTASCHPGRLGSGEAGEERRSRCRCQPECLLDTCGWAKVHCTSSPPSGCPAAGSPRNLQEGDRGGRSWRGVVGRWEGEARTLEERWGCCSSPHRQDTGLGLLRQLQTDKRRTQPRVRTSRDQL